MPPIRRPREHGPIIISVRLIEKIEALTAIDCEPPPSVIAPLMARVEANWDAGQNPEHDDELVADTEKLLADYGSWLYPEEIHVVQRLRGWHRTRYGRVTVDAYWLTAARNLMDSLTLSLGEECDETLREYGLDRVGGRITFDPSAYPGGREIRAEVLKSMRETGGCGDCKFCIALRLRDECDSILDAAGYYGGSYYEAYARREAA